MRAISNSHQSGPTKFGPSMRQQGDSLVEWFSISLFTKNGQQVPGVCRVHKDYLHECTVRLGVGTFKDFDKREPAKSVVVPYIADRAFVLGRWDVLIHDYESSL